MVGFAEFGANAQLNVVFHRAGKQHHVSNSHKKLLRTMYSHGIPSAHDEDGEGQQDPDQNFKKTRAGFIQAAALHRENRIRRAGEQTSPQVARAVGDTRNAGQAAG